MARNLGRGPPAACVILYVAWVATLVDPSSSAVGSLSRCNTPACQNNPGLVTATSPRPATTQVPVEPHGHVGLVHASPLVHLNGATGGRADHADLASSFSNVHRATPLLMQPKGMDKHPSMQQLLALAPGASTADASLPPAHHAARAHLDGSQPLVFQNSAPAHLLERGREALSRSTLTAEPWGRIPVEVCRPEGTPLRGCVLRTLGEWVEALPKLAANVSGRADQNLYLFNSGGRLERNYPQLLQHYPQPPHIQALAEVVSGRQRPQRCKKSQLGIGQSGAGLPFHWHDGVFNEVVAGAKRWFISRDMPPSHVDPLVSSLEWLRTEYPSVVADGHPHWLWEVTVYPGEVLFVPPGFYHATVNVGETVSITYRCDDGRPPDPTSVARADVPKVVGRMPSLNAQVEYLERASKADPTEPGPVTFLAMVLRRRGDLHRACSAAREAYRRNPRSADAMALVAELYAAMGDKAGAARFMQEATRADPLQVSRCAKRGIVLASTASVAEAASWLQGCVEVATDQLAAATTLGSVLQVARARAALQRVVDTLHRILLRSPSVNKHVTPLPAWGRALAAARSLLGMVPETSHAEAATAAAEEYSHRVQQLAADTGVGSLASAPVPRMRDVSPPELFGASPEASWRAWWRLVEESLQET